MSPSKKPRVVRTHKPKRKFTENTYRKSKPSLLQDFGQRCAYSLQHVHRIGWTDMEVDHHNPKLTGAARNRYENLYPASRHCNGSKSDNWPDAKMRRSGVRFLNPCEETDYGDQIFEDSKSFLLVGTTPAAIYHIRVLGLNAPHLIEERKERSLLAEILEKRPGIVRNSGLAVEKAEELRRIRDLMIPSIPPPPIGAPPRLCPPSCALIG